jgi:hypothetical protein
MLGRNLKKVLSKLALKANWRIFFPHETCGFARKVLFRRIVPLNPVNSSRVRKEKRKKVSKQSLELPPQGGGSTSVLTEVASSVTKLPKIYYISGYLDGPAKPWYPVELLANHNSVMVPYSRFGVSVRNSITRDQRVKSKKESPLNSVKDAKRGLASITELIKVPVGIWQRWYDKYLINVGGRWFKPRNLSGNSIALLSRLIFKDKCLTRNLCGQNPFSLLRKEKHMLVTYGKELQRLLSLIKYNTTANAYSGIDLNKKSLKKVKTSFFAGMMGSSQTTVVGTQRSSRTLGAPDPVFIAGLGRLEAQPSLRNMSKEEAMAILFGRKFPK